MPEQLKEADGILDQVRKEADQAPVGGTPSVEPVSDGQVKPFVTWRPKQGQGKIFIRTAEMGPGMEVNT